MIDKRKKYYMVIDTETSGLKDVPALAYPLIYDLAWVICDKQGNIYEEHNYLISEVYRSSLMQYAFYGNKLPIYEVIIAEGMLDILPFAQVLSLMNESIAKYPNITIAAYNLNFDLRALHSTAKYTRISGYKGEWKTLFNREVSIQDIWSLAVETIYSRQVGYRKFIERYGLYTPAGNPISSAEAGYRYITNDIGFVEDHMALSDCRIEVEILSLALRQRKIYTRGIRHNPWQLLKYMKKQG